jgi:hypothetical protein
MNQKRITSTINGEMAIWVCAVKRKTRETLMGDLGSQHVRVIVHMRRCPYIIG